MNQVVSLNHAVLAVVAVLAGWQDWRRREVADWMTSPLLFLGLVADVVNIIQHMNFLGLVVSAFLIVTWYFGWMGGADVRVLMGIWGLWPLAGFLSLVSAGLWGLVLVWRKHGKDRIPALVSTACAVGLLFIIEFLQR